MADVIVTYRFTDRDYWNKCKIALEKKYGWPGNLSGWDNQLDVIVILASMDDLDGAKKICEEHRGQRY